MNRALRAIACVLVLGASLLVGCAAPSRAAPGRLPDSAYPGRLRPPSELVADILWRQRVTAEWEAPEHDGEPGAHGQWSFEAAVQKQGDTLTLLGLSSLGTTAFVLTLKDEQIEFVNHTRQELPFPPRFIVLDVQRVFFPWLAVQGSAPADGEHAADMNGEHVVEIWREGRLAERRFTRLDGQPAGTITVRYESRLDGRLAPARATLDNGWFGYRLTIDTLEETRLPPAE